MAYITEATLEMHFHSALMDLFRSTFGLGANGQINFFKYSPQRECFIGFDQAYVKSTLGPDQFFSMLKGQALSNNYRLPANDQFFGYFLQYKVVQPMRTRTRHTPSQVSSIPHYRVKLDTSRNMQTGLSQHELLFNLGMNKGAMVYYACPMLFDREELYPPSADLDSLKLADISTCPSSYADNEKHFIFFDDPNSNPIWCSRPTEGKQAEPNEFALKLKSKIDTVDPKESRAQLLDLLTDVEHLGVDESSGQFWKEIFGKERVDILDLAYESLTILKVNRG
jgi:hypothetical protein